MDRWPSLGRSDVSAVVAAVLTDGVDHNAVVGDLKAQRLGVEGVEGNFVEQGRHKFIQGIRQTGGPHAESFSRQGSPRTSAARP